MANLELMRSLSKKNDSKIVLLVLDGLGGLPLTIGGATELEAAATPIMDRLAKEGSLGFSVPIRLGITPGSGPAHLALFGYDPLTFNVGRGVLEAFGIGLEVRPGDIAARGNFCTVDAGGSITDRRAGRISTEEALPLVSRLSEILLKGVNLEVRHVREYRFAVVMRGEELHADIEDTDPQQTGLPPLPAVATDQRAQATSELFNQWITKARECLADQTKANALTLRGFSTDPELPRFPEIYSLSSVCIAVYPMYRGVSQLVGMNVLSFDGEDPQDEFLSARSVWQEYDFFFIHIKKTDSKGEDGDFDGKAHIIETVDAALPALLDLNPDVLVITGDHSTPSKLRTHSWHPVPLLLWAPGSIRPDSSTQFHEKACAQGGLGTFLAQDLMQQIMAHAGRLEKYGA